jgi:N-methylhydantoinase B
MSEATATLANSGSEGIEWDGVKRPYIPDMPKVIAKASEHLEFYDERTDVDPVLFEVIRHNLLQITDDHGKVIERLSGSPITLYTNDFNAGILTAQGEILSLGPYVQWFAAMMDTVVAWILENRSENPGINPGDMFLTNDPWVGTLHQQDVGVMAPVFTDDGKLIAWVGNFAHHYDVGGTIPGSFVPNANDVFDEGVPLPPIKIVAGGKLQKDVEELFLRNTRQPDIVRLDLHAQIAANDTARRKVEGAISRYGEATVNSVMHRILDAGEKAFVERLKKIPKGRWTAEALLDSAREGDRKTYKVVGNLINHGDRLELTNDGTDPQVGILNASYACWRGSMSTVLNATLAYDQLYAMGGALRRIKFTPKPDTINCASYPSSMSCGGTIGGHHAVLTAHLTIARMLSSSDELRNDLICQQAGSQWPVVPIAGKDAQGRDFGTAILDGMIGGLGAFAFRDGVDTGGLYFIPKGRAANVEEAEDMFPILYLARREKVDSGGAGKYRGGNSLELLFIPHGTDEILHTTATGCVGVPTGLGLYGGMPSCTNVFAFVRDTDVLERLARGEVPTSIEDFPTGRFEALPGKSSGSMQKANDVYVMYGTAGAGYGDPLTRDPEAVLRDVELMHVTAQTAEEFYGVKIVDGMVDEQGTEELRGELRKRRLTEATRKAEASGKKHPVDEAKMIGPHLGVVDASGVKYVCLECGEELGAVDENYKDACCQADSPTESSNPLTGGHQEWIDDDVVFRRFFCPSCATMIDTEVTLRDRASVRDIELFDPASLI